MVAFELQTFCDPPPFYFLSRPHCQIFKEPKLLQVNTITPFNMTKENAVFEKGGLANFCS